VSGYVDEHLIGLREASHHWAQSLAPLNMTRKLLFIDRVNGEQITPSIPLARIGVSKYFSIIFLLVMLFPLR